MKYSPDEQAIPGPYCFVTVVEHSVGRHLPGKSVWALEGFGMLTLHDFSRLPLEAQLSHLWEHGSYLESRLEGNGCIVRLYQVDLFFVEVCFRSIDEFRLVQAFNDPTLLMPYVERVNLGDLLE